MATSWDIAVSPKAWEEARFGSLKSESVSFTSSAGDQNSSRAVPAGKLWLLRTLRSLNGEAGAHNLGFKLVDPDGLQYATLSMSGIFPQSIGAQGECCWFGDVPVAAGWTVRAYFLGMTGGSTCNWQYTVIEVPL